VRFCSTASTTTGWARALTSTLCERSQVGEQGGLRVAKGGVLDVCHMVIRLPPFALSRVQPAACFISLLQPR
jgi:hypothetical protein